MNAVEFVTKTFHDCGGTFSLHGGPVPEDGYLVGGAGSEHIFSAHTFTADKMQAFINENRTMLEQEGFYLGTWMNDGKVYLDVSEHIESFDRAYALALHRGELALWDVARKEEINVRG